MGATLRHSAGPEDRAATLRRVARAVRRLEALVARARLRRRVVRGLRGGTGAGGTLLTLIKLKVAGSLALKLGLAALVGLGFAWPALALGLVAVLGLVLALLSLFSGEGGFHGHDLDWSCDCPARRARLERAKDLIARRRAWLADPSGPAPSALRGGAGHRRGRGR